MHEVEVIDWVRRNAPGARVEEAGGRTRVVDFGDPSAEYAALRGAVALLPAPGWATILAEGADAVDYLHRRLSAAIKPLAPGTGVHALLLGGDGRMQAEFLAWRGEDAVMLATPRARAEPAFELLERYVLMDEVELTRFWLNEPTIALAGPRAVDLLAGMMDPKPDAAKLKSEPWSAWLTVNIGGLPCRVLGEGRYGVPVYYLSVPPMAVSKLLGTLAAACREMGGGFAGETATELLRIEAGVTLFGRDTDERTIPLDAGLGWAVAMDKGCYPGQEVLARIINLGHPARALVRLTLEGERAVEDGAAVMVEGEEVGGVTSSVTWPGLGRTEALGSVKWGMREEVEVKAVTGEGEREAKMRAGEKRG
jgi:folate-binding protein YgfZ